MTSRKLEIKYVPIDAVKPWGRNPKKHNKKAIVESLKRFKPTQPILVQKGTGLIIAGHGRLEAFKELGYEELPITELEMSDAEARAYALVDNQTVIAGGWDDNLLLSNLQELKLELPELDMSIFGFSDKQTGKKGEEDDYDVDAAIDDDVEPITKPGDVIKLGDHRLMCGDSTDAEAVTRLLDEAPDLLLTDPPYCSGGFQESGRSSGSIGTTRGVRIGNDMLSTRGYQNLLRKAIICSGAPSAYIFTDWRMWNNLFDVVEACGLGVRAMIVWDKGSMGMGVGWRMQHELIMHAHRLDSPYNVHGYAQGNVLRVSRTGNPEHPTQKPIELIAEMLKVSAYADTVYDPFGGSGSTLIACEQLNRRCYMMDLDPRYCDVIIQRWEEYTGEKAVRT